jgi:thymidylate synthase
MQEYKDLVRHVLLDGTRKENRTGIDTISKFGYHYKIDLAHGFPLLTTKKINWKNIVIENLWFLSGNSSWDFFHKHGVHFWDAWDEGRGKLPKAYGEFWRKYPYQGKEKEANGWTEYSALFDQFAAIINELKTNPNSRRMCLTNWFPPSAWSAKLPPCHAFSVFNVQYVGTEPKLCLHMTQRSCDVALGVPFNIASYSFLLHLVAHLTKLQIGQFSHTLVDAHLYCNHLEGVKRQLKRKPRMLPQIVIDSRLKTLDQLDDLIADGTTAEIMDTFQIKNYDPHPFIKYEIIV